MPIARLNREAAEDTATAELRNAILAGVLMPGTRLRQEELAAQMGVSRMPIRQALLALEREGLVKTDRWRQTIVSPLEPDMIRDMYEFRAIIERHVADTLANRPDFDTAPLRQIIAAGKQAVKQGDIERAIELDLQFHTMLYDSVGNQVLSSSMRYQWAHIRRVMAATLTLPRFRARVWDEHAAILDAIAAHDAQRAVTEVANHMIGASAAVLSHLSTIVAEPESAVEHETRKSRDRASASKTAKRAFGRRRTRRTLRRS